MSVKTSDYSFEKASYYAFRTASLTEISTFTATIFGGAILSGLILGNKVIAASALNVTACIMTSVALPLITLIGLRVLMGYFAEKSYIQAKTAQNTEEAFKLYKYAADYGQKDAPWDVGSMYQDGHGVTKDDDKALKYFSLAILRGSEKTEELKKECIKLFSAKNPSFKDITIEKFNSCTLVTNYTDAQGKKFRKALARD